MPSGCEPRDARNTLSTRSSGESTARDVRALYFGTYDRSYPRNAQVISCLRGAGVEIRERHEEVWGRHNWALGPRMLPRLALAERRLARRRDDDADVIIVGYPGHFDLPAARRIARGRPIIFNALVSLHDTLVTDRGRFRVGSIPSRALARLDRFAFRRADLVVADTNAHARFFKHRFDLLDDRVAVAYVGAEDRLFYPGSERKPPFHAMFVGKLIPLQGIETILQAARLAPEIGFRIVGDGQLSGLLDERPENVTHVPWIDYEELPGELRRAGCALGIFGSSPKAARVIPNKAFQAIACGTPLVTADTPAARELLTGGRDAVLVPPGDPQALADAVRSLARDRTKAADIGDAGRQTYLQLAGEDVLGGVWRALLERVVAAG
jgi:glycosyltransferase involved in cell wall biosynthesis